MDELQPQGCLKMYEILIPTTKQKRYQYHQLLADMRAAHNLGDAQLQCAKLGDYLYVRSSHPFPGARKRELKGAEAVSFSFDYCCGANHCGKMAVKNDEQIFNGIMRALAAGGLSQIELSIGEIELEPFTAGLRHGRETKIMPVVRVDVSASIEDSQAFELMVLSGIGKRRSYGLGMVLLGLDAYAD